MVTVLRVAPVLAGMTLMLACSPDEDAELDTLPADEVPAVTEEPVTDPALAETTAMFEPGPAGGNVSGLVRIIPEDDQDLRLEVQLTGLTEGEHAWHIHNAPCGEEGPVVVAITPTQEQAEGLADAIEAGSDGTATADVTIPRDRIPAGLMAGGMTVQPGAAGQAGATQPGATGGQFSLHVHERGGVDHGATVACANLSQSSAPTDAPVTPDPDTTIGR